MTHYCVLRRDLPPGDAVAQLVHAAGESSPGGLPPETRAVVLAASSAEDLEAVAQRLTLAGIPHVLIREPDPPYSGAATALGITPVHDRRAVRRALGRLPLYGKEQQ